jgi:hypothetical protein
MLDEQEGTLPMWGSNKDGTLIRLSVGKKSLQEIRTQTEDKEVCGETGGGRSFTARGTVNVHIRVEKVLLDV